MSRAYSGFQKAYKCSLKTPFAPRPMMPEEVESCEFISIINYRIINCPGWKQAAETNKLGEMRKEMNKSKMQSTSKFISLVLRHKPEEIGLTLDNGGWANVKELLSGLNKGGSPVTMEELEEIVRTDNKQRYSFNEEKTLIRANQGHSIPVDLGLTSVKPPKELYHGTAARFRDSIQKEGIKSMSRNYVHLSADKETASKVGKRHGKLMIIVIDSEEMDKQGIKFYQSENKVWLTDYVDTKYFKDIIVNYN